MSFLSIYLLINLEAETDKIPYMFIIGDREIEDQTVSVRKHKEGDIGTFERSKFIDKLSEDINQKRELEN